MIFNETFVRAEHEYRRNQLKRLYPARDTRRGQVRSRDRNEPGRLQVAMRKVWST